MEQLSKEQAIAFYESGAWKQMDIPTRAHFQMNQERLCMPFGEFQEAVGEVLGRPVFTHEFADADRLKAEMQGKSKAPSLTEIMEMIPKDKRVLIFVDND